MEYNFPVKEKKVGDVVFALTLDIKGMTERIVIGKPEETRSRMDGGKGDVFYDETRPLGNLFLNFEKDRNGIWGKNIKILHNSYGQVIPLITSRSKTAAPATAFFEEKYKSGEPSAVFAAIHTWESYLNCIDGGQATKRLNKLIEMLHKPFRVYGKYKPWQKEADVILKTDLEIEETTGVIWYPLAKRSFETVVTNFSFLPIIFHYLHKIEEWGLVFQECKVCNNYFITNSLHFEICSDECRKTKNKESRREHNKRIEGDIIEQRDNKSYQHWHNRWRVLKDKKSKHYNLEKAADYKAAMDAFRKEAKERKADIKRRKADYREFTDWLFQKDAEADRLIDELTGRNDLWI